MRKCGCAVAICCLVAQAPRLLSLFTVYLSARVVFFQEEGLLCWSVVVCEQPAVDAEGSRRLDGQRPSKSEQDQ